VLGAACFSCVGNGSGARSANCLAEPLEQLCRSRDRSGATWGINRSRRPKSDRRTVSTSQVFDLDHAIRFLRRRVASSRAPPCARCGAKLKVVRSISRLGLTLPQYASSSAPARPHRATRRPWQCRPELRKSPGCASRGFLCSRHHDSGGSWLLSRYEALDDSRNGVGATIYNCDICATTRMGLTVRLIVPRFGGLGLLRPLPSVRWVTHGHIWLPSDGRHYRRRCYISCVRKPTTNSLQRLIERPSSPMKSAIASMPFGMCGRTPRTKSLEPPLT